MPVSEASLRQKIEASFPGAQKVEVLDISGGCGQSFEVVVVSEEFAGKATLARHRLVNERLKEEIAELHAFSQKTYTPKQYEALGQKVAQ